VALWDEVKDKLKKSAFELSGDNSNGYVLPVLLQLSLLLWADGPTSAHDFPLKN
jgi:ABC-type phosphate transport system ATPase subunit